jgi:hypothetical protein
MQTYIHLLILLCKILVGNTQTRELHPVDAGYVMASKNYFSKAAASEFFIFHFCILFSTR